MSEKQKIKVELTYTVEGVDEDEAVEQVYALMEEMENRVGGYTYVTQYEEG